MAKFLHDVPGERMFEGEGKLDPPTAVVEAPFSPEALEPPARSGKTLPG
jgi:hypothetical protein